MITTYDENGGYPHPDHIMTHKISMVAFEAAGDPERYPEAGAPWQPLKLYYNQGFNRPRTVALHEALLGRGLESPYAEWLERWDELRPRRSGTITTHVPCGDFFEIRDKALIAHATQIDPDGGWFRVPMDLQREVWPTEDYELAQSLVDTSLPEDDLFAGVRDNGQVDNGGVNASIALAANRPHAPGPRAAGRGGREQGHPRRCSASSSSRRWPSAVWFLMKTMNRQLKKVDFEVEPAPGADRKTAKTAPAARSDQP